jgi:hypothetical protein
MRKIIVFIKDWWKRNIVDVDPDENQNINQ